MSIQEFQQLHKSCLKHTTAPFLIRYPSLMGFIVLVAPADPERVNESVDWLSPSESVTC